ncbi:MAG: hypothetical protein IPN62_19120 [Flavobacteriales bacterium]|nr:hypothetical protein [Flavobacteriales bacterium]
MQLYSVASMAKMSPSGFTVDLAASKYLSPVLLCGIAALMKHHQERGAPATLDPKCRDLRLRTYLSEIAFPVGLYGSIESQPNREALLATASKPYVPMVSFPADLVPNMEREVLLQSVENELVAKCLLDGPVVMAMKYILSEIIGNINYHAGRGTGFMIVQHSINNHYLDIAIADTGRGLRATYLASGKHAPVTDLEALDLALDGRSAKAETHRGFGIRTSRKLTVKGLGGWFLIWSGSAMLVDNASGAQRIELVDGSSFPGCYFAIRIPNTAPASFNMSDYYE